MAKKKKNNKKEIKKEVVNKTFTPQPLMLGGVLLEPIKEIFTEVEVEPVKVALCPQCVYYNADYKRCENEANKIVKIAKKHQEIMYINNYIHYSCSEYEEKK